MFGGPLTPPKRNASNRARNVPVKNDYHLIGYDGSYGHMAREPNTDHHVRTLHYQQREAEYKKKFEDGQSKETYLETTRQKFERHCESKRFRNEIESRVHARLADYERAIERRRDKLRDLFAAEEREFYAETVDRAQRGNEDKLEEMRAKAIQLKARREADRLKVVQEKRLQQYMARCLELRPALAKKHLIDSKRCQLEQIRDNEMRREAEREMNRMWHHLGTLQDKAMRDRDEQDAIERHNKEKAAKDVIDMQIKGKHILKQESARVAAEDRIEMEKLSELLRLEEIERQREKLRKKESTARELRAQIEEQQRFVEARRKAETALDSAFAELTAAELRRERDAVQDTRTQAKKEMAMYMANLRELEEENRNEERILARMLDEHKREILKKQQDAQCKIHAAKEALKKEVLATRAQQLEWKRQQEEQEARFKQAEDEMTRLAIEMNKKLEIESNRMKAAANKQYAEDLKEQIEYGKELEKEQAAELERQLANGRFEEARYEKQAADLIKGEYKVARKHPFRFAIVGSDCQCPTVDMPK